MKILINIMILFLLVFYSSFKIAGGSSSKYNLNSPVNTFKSFVTAMKNGDLVEVKNMLSPNMKKYLIKGNRTIEGYAEEWSYYSNILEVSKAIPIKAKKSNNEMACIGFLYQFEGIEDEIEMYFIKINGKWLVTNRTFE